MSLPSYAQFIWPLLAVLSRHAEPIHVSKLGNLVADELGLSEDDRNVLIPSGRMSVLRNCIQWAQDALKRAGLTVAAKWGHWHLTDQGVNFVKSHPNGITEEERKKLSRVNRSLKMADMLGSAKPQGAKTEQDSPPQTPEESLDPGLESIKVRVAGDLLDEILGQSPSCFQTLVVELLHKMGYGANRSSLKFVGDSGDGGIDEIISQDRLGLDRVYVQAKRWKTNVGCPEIQAFMGALNIQGASKGIFITTGELSGPAKETLKATLRKIVAIGDQRPTLLMMEHDLGVTNSLLRVPKVDKDYFDA